MLYAVTLSYIRPIEEVNAHLDTHRDWLVQQAKQARIIVAGPLEPRTGGFILLHCNDREELDRVLALDSFAIHRLVEQDVRAFDPVLRAEGFSRPWAPDAKAV